MKSRRKVTLCRSIVILLSAIAVLITALPGTAQTSREAPLIRAVKKQDIVQVRALLNEGENVNRADAKTGRTALMEAAFSDQAEICLLLLQHGAKVNDKDYSESYLGRFGETALGIAARVGHSALVTLLAEHGADVNTVDYQGVAPLLWALRKDSTEMVKILLDSHADPNLASRSGQPPLAEAALNNSLENIVLLLDHGAKVNPRFPLHVHFVETSGEKRTLDWSTEGVTPLILAAARGRLDIVKLLLEHGADLKPVTTEGQSALISAILQSRTDIVALLLTRKPEVNQITRSNSFVLAPMGKGELAALLLPLYRASQSKTETRGKGTPLSIAARSGNLEIVRLLLANKAEVNPLTPDTMTPLMAAAEAGHADICRTLIENKADVDARTAGAPTALNFAAATGHLDVCRLLIENKADVNAKSASGATLLMAASEAGNLEVVQLLIDHKAEVNAVAQGGMTALLAAARAGRMEVMRLLIHHAADVNVSLDEDNLTPLMYAAAKGDIETSTLLVNQGAVVTRRSKSGDTALACAIRSGKSYSEIALLYTLLIQHGANVNAPATLLNMAIQSGQAELCNLLIKNKASVNAPIGGDAPLCNAIVFKNREICKLLLTNHAEVNIRDAQGITPLMAASGESYMGVALINPGSPIETEIVDALQKDGDVELCRLLLEAGADVNDRDAQGRTALLYARKPEIIQLLIAHKADVNVVASASSHRKSSLDTALSRAVQDQDYPSLVLLLKAGAQTTPEEPPLFMALLQGDSEQTRTLLAQGATINKKDRFGFTALDCAVFGGVAETARLLIERGADVNGKDGLGRTPLMWAANPELCKLLLQHGAKVNARDREGFTPLLRAVAAGYAAVVQVLLDNNADFYAKSAQFHDVYELTKSKEVKEVLRAYHSNH